MTTGDLRFYDAPRSQAPEGGYQSRNATSTSPSVSVSQSLDHHPSNFSHASGASGQSTASSAVGSPYSQTQNLPAGQDHWVEMGLGIGGAIAPSEMFPPGTYQLTSAETDRVPFDDKFHGSFVGESTQFSQVTTSTSPTVSSSVSCSPFSEPCSTASPLTATSPDLGNLSDFKESSAPTDSSQTPFIANPGWNSTQSFSPSPFPSTFQRRDSQHHNTFFAQSSGNFVAPLESSCWFSLRTLSCAVLSRNLHVSIIIRRFQACGHRI